MKLMRYSRKHEPSALARLGIVVGHELVADLRAGYALYLVEETDNPKGRELAAVYIPPYIAQFLHMGEAAWLALGDAYTYLADLAQTAPDATGLNGEHLFIPLAECRLYAPLRPSKLIAIGRNYPGYTKNPGKQGGNDFRRKDWGGPCPPSGTHRYFFKLYALDKVLGLDEGADKNALKKAMKGHILAHAELLGLYKKRGK